MKRKLFLFLLIAAISCSAFVGCGGNGDTGTTESTTDPAQQAAVDVTTENATTEATINVDELSYLQYNAMSPENQQAVIDTFDTVEEFIDWFNEAKQEHEHFQELVNQGSTNTSTDPTGSENTDTTTPEVTNPVANDVTFLEYQAMSGMEQKKFINSFPSIDAFMAWHTAAMQEYKDSMTEFSASNPVIIPTESTETGD